MADQAALWTMHALNRLPSRDYITCYYCGGKGDDPEGADVCCPICGGDGEREVRWYEEEDRDED